MNVAAAIRIDSAHEANIIERAVAFSRQQNSPCFVVSVVNALPYGTSGDAEREVILHNLKLIEEGAATPVMQEGDDIAETLVAFGRAFRITTLFVQSGRRRLPGRSIAEQLLYLNPPFDVVVVGSQ